MKKLKPKLTEYDSVYCNMIEQHNKLVVPYIKKLNLSSVKIYNHKVITLQKVLAAELDIKKAMNAFAEYVVTNYFVLDFVDSKSLEECYALINTRDHSNMIIGSTAIYSLVKEKKKEIYANMDKSRIVIESN